MRIDPAQDGISHINVYSKGKTELGRMLSNFFCFPFEAKDDGAFMSIEGYWHWLGITPCAESNRLRYMHGYDAKSYGSKCRELLGGARKDEQFEQKIFSAIWYKFYMNGHLLTPEYYELPFSHYYIMGNKVVDKTREFQWMIDGIEHMRKIMLDERRNCDVI